MMKKAKKVAKSETVGKPVEKAASCSQCAKLMDEAVGLRYRVRKLVSQVADLEKQIAYWERQAIRKAR